MFAARGGVMWEKINDSQLRQYLISELERFNAQQDNAIKKSHEGCYNYRQTTRQ